MYLLFITYLFVIIGMPLKEPVIFCYDRSQKIPLSKTLQVFITLVDISVFLLTSRPW